MVYRKLRCSDKITHSPVLDKSRRACYYLPIVFTIVNTVERAGIGEAVSEVFLTDGKPERRMRDEGRVSEYYGK